MHRFLAAGLLVFISPTLVGFMSTAVALQEPTDERTQAAPARPLDHGMLRSVYFDLLGRPPFRAEIELWLGKGLRELLDELIGSREHWSAWQEQQLFHFLLIDNFSPRSERVLDLPEALTSERLDVREAIHQICLCSSFELRNPGADTFVTVVLEQLTGMVVQSNVRELEIGKTIYDGGEGLFLGRQGKTQSDVVRIAIESKEFSREFLQREYRRLLRVEPPRKGFASSIRSFHKDPATYSQLLREWTLSAEYGQRLTQRVGMPNRLFVKTLFVDLLNRLPTAKEGEPLREALDGLSDSGPLRSIVARLLLDSDLVKLPSRDEIEDRGAWIKGLFLRLMGRACTAAELATFSEAFADPACRTETVVYAIISHTDYQTF